MAGVEASAVFSQSIGIFEDGMGGAEEDELRCNCEGLETICIYKIYVNSKELRVVFG